MDMIGGVDYVLRSKRRHSAEFKARVIEAYRHPGVSNRCVQWCTASPQPLRSP
jgi:transposase-like protein